MPGSSMSVISRSQACASTRRRVDAESSSCVTSNPPRLRTLVRYPPSAGSSSISRIRPGWLASMKRPPTGQQYTLSDLATLISHGHDSSQSAPAASGVPYNPDRGAADAGRTMSAVRTEPGTRLLHIGPHKTGTSAIQGALYLARKRLEAVGVSYPGQGRTVLWPILAVTGQPPLHGEPQPKISYWEELVAQIAAAGDQRVVLSSEFFAQSDDATARRVVTDLGGDRVHVVVTLRSLTRILPSQWQQYIQNGFHFRYPEWLEGILSDPPDTPTPGFWLRHRHDKLVARWAAVTGKENLTVVAIDEYDRLMILRTFEAMLGLPDGFLVAEETAANR